MGSYEHEQSWNHLLPEVEAVSTESSSSASERTESAAARAAVQSRDFVSAILAKSPVIDADGGIS